MANLKPVTVQNFVVTLNGAKGLSDTLTFSKASAPKLSRTKGTYNDGQTGQEMATFGFAQRAELTLSKAYDPVSDAAFEKWATDSIEKPSSDSEFAVTIQAVQSDLAGTPIASSPPRTFTGCQVISLDLPDVDRSGSGTAMISIGIYYQNSTR